jgi:polysaccharide export outer membrane protein
VKLVQANQSPVQFQPTGLALAVVLMAFLASAPRRTVAQAPGAGAAAAAAAPAGGASGAPGQAAPTSTNGQRTAGDADRTTRESNESNERRAEVPAGSQDTRTEFQQMVEATTGRRLPIYGASLFTNVPSTFAPVDDVPVGPGYILGPGDEINVQLAGQINQQMRFAIDRSGAISLPGIGALHVAGMPYSELNHFLTEQLSKIYRNFTLNANLGALRTIQIFVVGQAVRPGTYSISSLSTLTNAIFASGGPASQGSVRDIQVKRGGVTIDHFDLYDLLLYGDKTHDIPLATGDVIFIPFVGPQVAVVGSIDNPAIYELKGRTTVEQALKLAGGDTPVAAGSTVRVERIYEHSMRSIQDIDAAKKTTELVQNGDIISVTSVIDRFRDAVTLRGNVANPGRYVWHQGMRISDLIPTKESLITRNYWRKRNQLGQLVQDYQPDQPDATAHGEGALEVHGNAEDRRADSTNRGGATTDAGGSSVGAALTANNGPFGAKTDVVLSAPDIDWNYAVIERQSTADLTTSLVPFNLGDIVLNHNAAQDFELLPGDVVTIFSKADIRVPGNQQTRYVRLEGEFNASGVYSVLPGESLRALIRRVGGFTPDAYLYASEFTRESTRRVETQRLHEYADQLSAQISDVTSSNLARATTQADQLAATASEADARSAVQRLRGVQPIGRIVLDLKPNSQGIDAVPDLALEDGDRFVVPRVPANITVEGQVYNANAFVYDQGEHMIDYLKRAGGPDRQADRKRTFILRADGSVVSHQYTNVSHSPIYPGDTIVVPPVIDKRSILQRIVSIASAVGNFGLGAAAIYLISRDN